MERIIPLQQAENVRDLGGYQTATGKQVQYRKMVRGASLAELSPADQTTLQNYGIVTVVDLRSPEEEEQQPDQPIPGAKNVFLPVFATDETEVSVVPGQLLAQLEQGFSAAEQMEKVYRLFVEGTKSRQAYHDFFRLLLENDQPEKSLLFHCTAGKDRTGFAAAMFLAALEVSMEDIKANYLETNQYLIKQKEQMVKRVEIAGGPQILIAGIRELMIADLRYLDASFASISENYGNVAGFLKDGLRLSADDLKVLRGLYTTA